MKWIIRIVTAIVIVVVVVMAGVFFYANSLAKSAIEKGATYAMGVQTTVGSVSVGLGDLGLTDLDIANPEGYPSDHFFKLGHAEASVSLASLMQDTIEVPYIRADQIDMNLETREGKANFQHIMDNLAKLKSEDESTEGKGYVVRELSLTNITVHAVFQGKTIPIKIDEIKQTNIGSGEGQSVDMKQLTGIVMKAIFDSLMKNPDLLPDMIAGQLQKGIGEIGDLGVQHLQDAVAQFEDVLGEKGVKKVTDEVGKAVDDVGKAVEDIAEGFGNLLKKKEKSE